MYIPPAVLFQEKCLELSLNHNFRCDDSLSAKILPEQKNLPIGLLELKFGLR